jgi:2-keto-3-deoxy-L-fuconate dehydrogenase
MSGRLKGKRAFVTAAAAGIGRASAIAFAREGATVIATDIDDKQLAALTKEGVANVARLDVRDSAAVAAMAKEVGTVDVLLNAAGFVHHGTVLECSDDDWDFSFDLNVKSMHRTIKAYIPGMLEQGGGSIVNIASGAGSVRGIPNRYVYGASKAAVVGLTKAVAADFIRDGVRCNAIAPGTFKSPSWEDRVETLGKEWGSKEKALEMFVQRQPMGRVADAAEIAPIVVYLASDEAAFTTGTVMNVDGGFAL